MAKKKDENKGGTAVDLEEMDNHFGDDDSLAQAINAALQDADAAIQEPNKGNISEKVDDDDLGDAIDIEEEMVIDGEADLAFEEGASEGEKDIADTSTEVKNIVDGLAELPGLGDNYDRRLETEIAKQQEYYDQLLRLMAEFENYKKRQVRDRKEFSRFANENIITDTLPALDNFERAIAHCERSKDLDALLDGIKMIFKQMKAILGKHGVRAVQSVGKNFDPTKHQAVQMRETDDVDPNMVVEEFQKGYFLHERLIRPAMVVVACQMDDNQEDPEEISEDDEGMLEEAEVLEDIEPVDEEEELEEADVLDETEKLEELDEVDVLDEAEVLEETTESSDSEESESEDEGSNTDSSD